MQCETAERGKHALRHFGTLAPWHFGTLAPCHPGTLALCHLYNVTVPTLLLLLVSNVFMTFAWYGHLRYGRAWPLWKAIAISWMIALIEYCLAVPANRLGYGQFSGFQLKIVQEVVTLAVFIGFAISILKERLAWNYVAAFVFLGVAAFFAFAFKVPPAQ